MVWGNKVSQPPSTVFHFEFCKQKKKKNKKKTKKKKLAGRMI